MPETVVILGASPNVDRYSHMAKLALEQCGHNPVLVNPRYDQIEGIRCYPDLSSCPESIDTVTVYVRPGILRTMVDQLIRLHPGRVIFNPGAECDDVAARLASAGIGVQNACTLVLLNLNRF